MLNIIQHSEKTGNGIILHNIQYSEKTENEYIRDRKIAGTDLFTDIYNIYVYYIYIIKIIYIIICNIYN